MNVIRKMSPHAAILIANMYYVFYGIDRVNTAMNFINNGYTKTLLLLLIACFAVMAGSMQRQLRRRSGDDREWKRRVPLLLNAALCAAVTVIMAVDFFLGDRGMPFLNESVKFIALSMCIVTWFNAARLISAERAAIRAGQARRRPPRQPVPPRQPARSGSYGQPARSRYDEERYTASRSRYGEEGYTASRSRYGEGGYTASRSRYGEERYSSSRSRYSEGNDSRYGSSSRNDGYVDEGIRRSSRNDGYDRAARASGSVSRSAYGKGSGVRRTSRYSDSDF